jgi:hypothetical protein
MGPEMENKEQKVMVGTIPIYISFSERGAPASEPGALYVDDLSVIKRMKEIYMKGEDEIEESATPSAYGDMMTAYAMIYEDGEVK